VESREQLHSNTSVDCAVFLESLSIELVLVATVGNPPPPSRLWAEHRDPALSGDFAEDHCHDCRRYHILRDNVQ
jgi:hypothetical protein